MGSSSGGWDYLFCWIKFSWSPVFISIEHSGIAYFETYSTRCYLSYELPEVIFLHYSDLTSVWNQKRKNSTKIRTGLRLLNSAWCYQVLWDYWPKFMFCFGKENYCLNSFGLLFRSIDVKVFLMDSTFFYFIFIRIEAHSPFVQWSIEDSTLTCFSVQLFPNDHAAFLEVSRFPFELPTSFQGKDLLPIF